MTMYGKDLRHRTHASVEPDACNVLLVIKGRFNTLIALALILGLASCAGYSGVPTTGPQVPSSGTLTPSLMQIDFGDVLVGASATQSLSLTNAGTTTLNIMQATTSGIGFALVGGNSASSLPVGRSTIANLQFTPQTDSTSTGTFTVTSNASNSPLNVSLTGNGRQGRLTISPFSVSFGSVTVGQIGTQSVTLTNTGNFSVTLNLATVSGSGFGISGLALPTTISPNQSITFGATFT